MSGKFALIIANTEYTDPGLAQLTAPGKDAEEFARVLKSPDIAAFDDVSVLVNENATTARESIDEFFARKTPDDLLVLYFSGHGVRDEFGALYLAVKNTNRDRLRSTAINSSFIREGMDQSRSKRQVLILDCCNSGAFAQGTKAEVGGSVGTASAFEGTGYGRFVLTASDSTQFAWEGDKIIGETVNSLFTHFLVKGLEGEADRDGNGAITVDELYDYAYEQIVSRTPKQTPGKWSYKQQGEIVLRQNIRVEDTKPIPLPDDLIAAINSSLPYVREGAVHQLEILFGGKNLGLARSARLALEKIKEEDDSRSISRMATDILERTKKDVVIVTDESVQKNAKSSQALVQQSKSEFRSRLFLGIAAAIALALFVTGGIWIFNNMIPTSTPEEPVAPTEEPAAQAEELVASEEPTEELPDVDFAVMPGGALEAALKGIYKGTTVTVDGAFEGNDPDGVKMDESVAEFEALTGIDVNYIGSREFEATISLRVEAGDAPDIVDFPNPSKAAQFVKDGRIVDVTSFLSEEWLSQQYNQSWRDMITIDSVEAGVFHRFNGMSLVWYPKDDWEAAGYEIPTTWDELMALNQTIADDGDTPWCIGIESQAATGWVATHWTANMMLRTTSLENYDAWVAGELAFNSPEVKKAIKTWSELWFNDDYVLGGRSSIVSTFFGDSPAPMFEDPPQCWMHNQGNFITSFFFEGVEYGVDYDFFYFPPVDNAYGKPFLVTGDVMVMFNDRPEVRALMEYFTVPQSASGWLEGGGALAAHQTATPDMYSVNLERGIAELVAEATSFRFDAIALMPNEVGAGSFWEHITSYVAGSEDLDTAMQAIDASWPR